MRSAILACLMLAASATSAFAQEGNPARGRAYAEERCAACHAIALNGGASPNRDAITFRKIANTPGMTPMALTAWLHSSHKNMPDLIVKGEDLTDLIAYIRSLKSHTE